MLPDDTDRARRLATWLEGLGLDDQLEAAGLPTFVRDAGGLRWVDPLTGDALSEDQLVELDALLHQQGDSPAHAVPVALVQLRRRAEVRARLLATPTYDYAGLAQVRGTSVDATRFAVHKAANRGALLVVPVATEVVVPAFQLVSTGEARPELGALLEPLLTSGTDPWAVWAWLTQPVALLGGAVPEEAVRDPDEAPVVRHAALRLAERSRTSLGR